MIRPADVADALRFLTRLPLPPGRAGTVGFGAAAFPIVGLMLGGLAVVLDVAIGVLPESVRAIAVLALWAGLTGALHYDGLADVLDALGARTREERLRVMRDSAVGTFAVLGLVLVVAAELAALAALAGGARLRALVVAPTLGRLAMLLAAFAAPRAREDGLGAEFVRRLEARDVVVAGLLALASSVLVAGARGLVACVVAGLVALAVRSQAVRAFGGVTGDVLGACGKLTEAAVLVLWTAR